MRINVNSKIKYEFFRCLGLVAAGIVNATGVILFLSSSGILDGGLSGTAMLLDMVFSKIGIDVLFSVFIVVLNVPFFLIGMKKLGFKFVISSAVAIGTYAGVSAIYQAFGLDKIIWEQTDIFLCAVFGGLLSGVGSGLTIRFGGAMDGMEATAVIFAKKIGLTVGQFVMIYNAAIYTIACVALGEVYIGLYSIVTYVVGIKAVDFVVEGLDKGKGCFIITSRGMKVAGALSEEFNRGVTLLPSRGYHSKTENVTVYCVVNRFEIGRLKSIVKSVDPNAFVTIQEISDVLGSSIKFSRKKKDKKGARYQIKKIEEPTVEQLELPLDDVIIEKKVEENKKD